MTLSEAASLSEIVGALAVVGSLIYVGIQVRQSNAIARATAYRAIHDDIGKFLTPLSTDPEIHRIWEKAILSEEELQRAEQDRLGMILFQLFGALNSGYQSAWLDASIRDYVETMIDLQLSHRHIRMWWRRQGALHPEPFQTYVNKRLKVIEGKLNHEARG